MAHKPTLRNLPDGSLTREEVNALLDAITAVLDGDDGGNEQHGLAYDDPGTGSGPAFCFCGEWDETKHITWGQHIADEVERRVS